MTGLPEQHRASTRDDAPAGYAALPESIKAIYSVKEWLWLTDVQKAQLVRRETEPEWDE